MRVYHIDGPHKGFPGGATFLYKAMQRLPGIQAYHYECMGNAELWGKRDLNIEVDWDAEKLGYPHFPIPHPSFFWCSDTHRGKSSREYRMLRAAAFDQVGVSIKGDVEAFSSFPKSVFWLPYAAEPTCYKPFPELTELFDVGFVGNYSHYEKRIDFLDTMFKAFPNCYVADGAHLEHAAKLFCQMKVVLNHCETDCANMRVFEVLATGRCLLTSWTSDLKDLGLVDGEHLATYRSTGEAIEKAEYYLANPDARLRLGMQGRNVVLDRHTYIHRALKILEKFGTTIEMSPETWHEVLTEVPMYDTDILRPSWKKKNNIQ